MTTGRGSFADPAPFRPTSIAVAASASTAKPIAPARIQRVVFPRGTSQLWNMVIMAGW